MSGRYNFRQFLRGWLPDRGYPLARSPIRALLAGTLVTVLLSSFVLASFLAVSQPPPLLPVVQPGRDAETVVGGTEPAGIAVDQKGTLFWSDETSGQLLSLTSDGTAPTVVLEGLHEPQGVAVDAVGNVHFTEYTRGTLSELPSGSKTPRVVLKDLDFPTAVTMDSFGNLIYIEGPSVTRMTFGEWAPAPCGLRIVKFDRVAATFTSLATWTGERGQYRGFCDISADVFGTVYYTTGGRGTVERLRPASLSSEELVSGLEIAGGVDVDAKGNVFFGEVARGVYVLASGAEMPVKLSGFGGERAFGRVKLDAAGNVYYDGGGSSLLKVPASRVQSALGVDTPTLPWPFNLLATEAIFGLTAVPAILGAWLAYGRRNRRWYRAVKVRDTPTIPSFPDGGQQATRSPGPFLRQKDTPGA